MITLFLETVHKSFELIKILVVSECSLKRLGELSISFFHGTCGTFIINSLPTIVLCFYLGEGTGCRALTRKNDGILSDIIDFAFETEFEIDRNAIPNSKHNHYLASMANYQGFPLILGGWQTNKLELLNTNDDPFRWTEYNQDNPYSHS